MDIMTQDGQQELHLIIKPKEEDFVLSASTR